MSDWTGCIQGGLWPAYWGVCVYVALLLQPGPFELLSLHRPPGCPCASFQPGNVCVPSKTSTLPGMVSLGGSCPVWVVPACNASRTLLLAQGVPTSVPGQVSATFLLLQKQDCWVLPSMPIPSAWCQGSPARYPTCPTPGLTRSLLPASAIYQDPLTLSHLAALASCS